MTLQNEITVWASLGATINLGNFENQKIDIGVSGVPVGATREEIQEKIVQASSTFDLVLEGLASKMTEIMAGYGR